VTHTTEVPGRRSLELAHLVLDVNGTLTDRGELIDEVEPQLRKLQETMEVHLVSADTFGSLGRIASILGVDSKVVDDGVQKASFVWQLGAHRCAAIGNGANDEAMLREAALGIAVIGPEGAAASSLAAADIVCRSIGDALRLLLDDQALAATLRP
jgi:soluble P-type ATPase